MADRVVVLSSRPATLKKLFDISLDLPAKSDSPFERRNANDFRKYYKMIWKELELDE